MRTLPSIAGFALMAAATLPSSAATTPDPAPARITLTATATTWPSATEAWSYGNAFLGTALGSDGQLRHEGGWDARAAWALGSPAAGPSRLRVELCFGQDRLALSEHLAPVHVGTTRRYDLGRLERRRLTARLGTGFPLRRGLAVSAGIGLVDHQFNTFRVAADDPELPFAVGGRLEVSARDATLLFNPLEVDLRLDVAGRCFVMAGCAYDRLEAPLAWSIAGAPAAAGARDQLAVSGALFHFGAGVGW